MLITDSRVIWRALNGVICIYKPAGVTCNQIRKTLITNICKELNEMKCRPPDKYVSIEGATNKQLSINVRENYADHPLVVGPRYQPGDVRCTWSTYLGNDTSGVTLYGINEGTRTTFRIRESKPLRTYKLSGRFGEATDNYFKNGQVMERATFNHIKRKNIDNLLAGMQGSHQKKMFDLCGVDINSQAAYELAIQGPIRPTDSKIPLIYGIKCTFHESPYFSIEVQCINEYEMYLKTLIHEIGMQMRSTAHCVSIQCIRHSYFTTEDALLGKHWTLQNIAQNMAKCADVINNHKNITKKQTANLQKM